MCEEVYYPDNTVMRNIVSGKVSIFGGYQGIPYIYIYMYIFDNMLSMLVLEMRRTRVANMGFILLCRRGL